jgi:uncharacterized damage-inducible protein DinB
MFLRCAMAFAIISSLTFCNASTTANSTNAAGEYARHFSALSKLSVAVAETMPGDQYGFRPAPESMTFGELMAHIATTNYQFCAGLKDAPTPTLPSASSKESVVKFLGDSFDYCSEVINGLSDEQLSKAHDSPDGRLPGRDILLAMYIHVAHHRGQAEIYLRDRGIKPPPYRI